MNDYQNTFGNAVISQNKFWDTWLASLNSNILATESKIIAGQNIVFYVSSPKRFWNQVNSNKKNTFFDGDGILPLRLLYLWEHCQVAWERLS